MSKADLLLQLVQPLENIMRNEVISLHCLTPREDAAEELAKRKYFAAPVVDVEGRMLGIVKAEHRCLSPYVLRVSGSRGMRVHHRHAPLL